MIKFLTYFLVIILTTLFFGMHAGIVEIKDPNRVPYEKSKHWTVED